MSFVGSYVWKLRQALGSQRILVPGVAMLLVNKQGELLLGKRAGTGEWSFIGGAMELGESMLDAAVRETQEELGLTTYPQDWSLIGVHTNPAETSFDYPNGDAVQAINSVFLMQFDGPMGEDDGEHTEFDFFPLENLPTPLKPDSIHTFNLYRRYVQTGQVQVN